MWNSIGLSTQFAKVPSTLRLDTRLPLYVKQEAQQHVIRPDTSEVNEASTLGLQRRIEVFMDMEASEDYISRTMLSYMVFLAM